MTERQVLRDAIDIRRSENFCFAHRAPAFSTFPDHQMPATRAAELDFTSPSDFEPLGD